MVDGIVLAGGYSSRAKTNKMTFEYQNKPLIIHTIETMHKVCKEIYVVTGYYHNELAELLQPLDYVTVVYNKNYSQGMFESIRAGVRETNHDFFITPGDCPNISYETYNLMSRQDGDIIVPSYNHRLGHPILFRKHYKEEILNTSMNNLKDFRNQYQFTIINVNDSGIIQDIDDLKDYKKLIGEE